MKPTGWKRARRGCSAYASESVINIQHSMLGVRCSMLTVRLWRIRGSGYARSSYEVSTRKGDVPCTEPLNTEHLKYCLFVIPNRTCLTQFIKQSTCQELAADHPCLTDTVVQRTFLVVKCRHNVTDCQYHSAEIFGKMSAECSEIAQTAAVCHRNF